MALRAYGLPMETFAIMYTRTCSLMFHGPGLNERLSERGHANEKTSLFAIDPPRPREEGNKPRGRCGRGILYFLSGRIIARHLPKG